MRHVETLSKDRSMPNLTITTLVGDAAGETVSATEVAEGVGPSRVSARRCRWVG